MYSVIAHGGVERRGRRGGEVRAYRLATAQATRRRNGEGQLDLCVFGIQLRQPRPVTALNPLKQELDYPTGVGSSVHVRLGWWVFS